MQFHKDRPLVVQSDFSILLESRHPAFDDVRKGLARFADLVKSPENLHTYRMSSLSLWNAAAAGMAAEEIITFLELWSKFGIPASVKQDIRRFVQRYGLVRMERLGEDLLLISDDVDVIKEMVSYKSLQSYGLCQLDSRTLRFSSLYRGLLKQELVKMGFPVEDLAGYSQGERLPIRLRTKMNGGRTFELRDYQQSAVESFYREGSAQEEAVFWYCLAGRGKPSSASPLWDG